VPDGAVPDGAVPDGAASDSDGNLIARGQPRSTAAAASLGRYERFATLPIVLSAVLPLVIPPQKGDPFSIAVGIVSWLVFLIDLIVRVRWLNRYLSTGMGRFDLAIVVLTAPWFLLPGAQAGGIVVVLRLARLARLVVASRGARHLFARLGRVAVVAGLITLLAAISAYHAEHPVNSEFATFGDALWWGIVTLTTVGYGDIVPETTTGRLAGVAIMFTGIAVLGLLAGSLASFFRLEPSKSTDQDGDGATPDATTGASDHSDDANEADIDLRDVYAEIRSLRAAVDHLTDRLGDN
jgi:voltage-gated potassium channel